MSFTSLKFTSHSLQIKRESFFKPRKQYIVGEPEIFSVSPIDYILGDFFSESHRLYTGGWLGRHQEGVRHSEILALRRGLRVQVKIPSSSAIFRTHFFRTLWNLKFLTSPQHGEIPSSLPEFRTTFFYVGYGTWKSVLKTILKLKTFLHIVPPSIAEHFQSNFSISDIS